MNKTKFFFYTFTGAFIWNLFLTWVGVQLGKEWHLFSQYSKPFEIAILIIIVGLIAWFIFKEIEKKILKRKEKKTKK